MGAAEFHHPPAVPHVPTNLWNAGEERFDFDVGVDDFELMIP